MSARPRTLKRERLIVVGRDDGHRLPLTRGDCVAVPRPCPYVSCKFNMYLDVSPTTGSIKLNFPDREPDAMPVDGSCVLDIAGRGAHTCEEAAQLMNLSRERVRQIEESALAKLKASPDNAALREYADGIAYDGGGPPPEYVGDGPEDRLLPHGSHTSADIRASENVTTIYGEPIVE